MGAAAVTVERCGCWVSVGGYDSICFLSENHEGQCLPLRSECMTQGEHWERYAQAIYDAVAEIDKSGGWPKELSRVY